MSAEPTEKRRAPRAVKVLVGLGLLQMVLLVVIGVALAAGSGDHEVRAELDASPTALVVAGVVVALIGLVNGVLAVLLGKGREGARTFFGVLNVFQVALAVFVLVGQRDLEFDSIWGLALPVVVLWFLYGSRATQEYFRP